MNGFEKYVAVATIMTIAALTNDARPARAQSAVTNNLFTAAGFIVQFADTPHKRKLLSRLPPDKLTIRTYGAKTYYTSLRKV